MITVLLILVAISFVSTSYLVYRKRLSSLETVLRTTEVLLDNETARRQQAEEALLTPGTHNPQIPPFLVVAGTANPIPISPSAVPMGSTMATFPDPKFDRVNKMFWAINRLRAAIWQMVAGTKRPEDWDDDHIYVSKEKYETLLQTYEETSEEFGWFEDR
jgi:hypothetical protein